MGAIDKNPYLVSHKYGFLSREILPGLLVCSLNGTRHNWNIKN